MIAKPSDSESALYSSIGCLSSQRAELEEFNESHSCDYSRLNDQGCEGGQKADRFVFIITDITLFWGPLKLTATVSRMDTKLCCFFSYDLNNVMVSHNTDRVC